VASGAASVLLLAIRKSREGRDGVGAVSAPAGYDGHRRNRSISSAGDERGCALHGRRRCPTARGRRARASVGRHFAWQGRQLRLVAGCFRRDVGRGASTDLGAGGGRATSAIGGSSVDTDDVGDVPPHGNSRTAGGEPAGYPRPVARFFSGATAPWGPRGRGMTARTVSLTSSGATVGSTVVRRRSTAGGPAEDHGAEALYALAVGGFGRRLAGRGPAGWRGAWAAGSGGRR